VVVRKSLTSPNAGSPGYIENNSFTNAVTGGFAIKNEGTGDAQSVCNWYGTTSAPVAATMNNGPVYLASILNSGVDGNPATGFQPSGTCIVPPVHNVTQNIYYTTIQAGVNGAVDGDQITVESGTYNEQVLVNKKWNYWVLVLSAYC
jgi:pectin methylesterase-like acyl-CoA thioesterase